MGQEMVPSIVQGELSMRRAEKLNSAEGRKFHAEDFGPDTSTALERDHREVAEVVDPILGGGGTLKPTSDAAHQFAAASCAKAR